MIANYCIGIKKGLATFVGTKLMKAPAEWQHTWEDKHVYNMHLVLTSLLKQNKGKALIESFYVLNT